MEDVPYGSAVAAFTMVVSTSPFQMGTHFLGPQELETEAQELDFLPEPVWRGHRRDL